MARLTGVCTGHKWPAYPQIANRRHPAGLVYYVNLLTFGPSMARLLNVAQAIFGPPGIFR